MRQILLAIILVASLAGCGQEGQTPAASQQQAASKTETPPENVKKPVIPGRDDMYQINVPLHIITPGKAPEAGPSMRLIVVAQGEKPYAWFKEGNLELYLPPRQFAEETAIQLFRITGNPENVIILQYGQVFYSVSETYSELKALSGAEIPGGLQ